MNIRHLLSSTLCIFSACVAAIGAEALATAPSEGNLMDKAHAEKAQTLINNGVAFLLAARNKDGSWDLGGGAFKPAATAMALKVLLQQPGFVPGASYGGAAREMVNPMAIIDQGFKVLLSYQQPDGGIYEPREGVGNYTTSLAVMALSASGDPRYKGALDKAVKYLREIQIAPGSARPDGTKVPADGDDVGGVNYGKNTGRPDMSNATFWVEAMHEAGATADDPAMQRALGFLTRVQNSSETSKSTIVAQGPNDGGFPYSMVESKAGKGPNDRGLRSYGSMTYAGFKSMLYAGVDRNDPRVRAAYQWIRGYWRLDANPNMPDKQSQQGLFYYYHVFSKALRAWGEPVIKDIDGAEHNWRQELIDALAARVSKDGSWHNEKADRWEEGSPVLVTCYAVLALEETLKK